MAKIRYHLHPETGVPGKCRATVRCPFGDLETEHYPTAEAAREAFEASMREDLMKSKKKEALSPEQRELLQLLESKAEALEGDRRAVLLRTAAAFARAEGAVGRSFLKWQVEATADDMANLGRGDLAEVLRWSGSVLDYGRNTAYFLRQQEEAAPRRARLEGRQAAFQERIAEVEAEVAKGKATENEQAYYQGRLEELQRHKKHLEEQLTELAEAAARHEDGLAKARAADRAYGQVLALREFTAKPRALTEEDKVVDGVNEFVFTTQDGERHTVREELEKTPYNYTGKLSIAQGEALQVAQTRANDLAVLLSTPKGGFRLPKSGQNFSGEALPQEELDKLFPPRGGFRLVSAGGENNVYLHEATQMVYKVPHEDSMMMPAWKLSPPKQRKVLQRAVHLTEEKYATLEGTAEEMAAEGHSEVEYLKTYFLQAKDSQGRLVPIVAQPKLDLEVHRPLNAAAVEVEGRRSLSEYLRKKGFRDTHRGNIFYNMKTQKVVLLDCLFVTTMDRESDYRAQGLI